MKTKFSWRNER